MPRHAPVWRPRVRRTPRSSLKKNQAVMSEKLSTRPQIAKIFAHRPVSFARPSGSVSPHYLIQSRWRRATLARVILESLASLALALLNGLGHAINDCRPGAKVAVASRACCGIDCLAAATPEPDYRLSAPPQQPGPKKAPARMSKTGNATLAGLVPGEVGVGKRTC